MSEMSSKFQNDQNLTEKLEDSLKNDSEKNWKT